MAAEPVNPFERVNLNRIDLNLLTVLSALLAERSVSRAAAKLHVTQPAISNALARLRDLIGDPLLIKTRKGMEPTERALELIDPVREALAKIRMAVENARPFDPAASVAEVCIAADDFAAHLFMPAVAQALIAEAPGLTLHVYRAGMDKGRSSDRERAMSSFHFMFAEPGREPGPHRCVPLVRESWKLVARKDHPGISGRLTIAQYAALPSVVQWYEGSQTVSWIDEALQKQGLTRHVAARVATPSPIVTAQGDHVMVLPESMARAYARTHSLAVHDVPLEGPDFQAALYWHSDYDAAPMHCWARERIVKVCKTIAGENAAVPVPSSPSADAALGAAASLSRAA